MTPTTRPTCSPADSPSTADPLVRTLRSVALIAAFLYLPTPHLPAVQAQTNHVFTAVQPSLAEPSDFAPIADAPGLMTLRRRLVRVNMDLLTIALARERATVDRGRPGDAADAPILTFVLFDDVQLSGVVEDAAPTASGLGYALSGSLRRLGSDDPTIWDMTLLIYSEMIAGTISSSEGIYNIRSVGNGVHAISHIRSTLPPDDEPLPAPPFIPMGSAASATDRSIAAADSGSAIDVAVFYTSAAQRGASGLPSVSNITQLVDQLFSDTNRALRDSGVDLRMNLVRLRHTSYRETRDTGTNLTRLSDDDDRYLNEVHTVRNDDDADLVHLLVDLTLGSGERVPSCGKAYVADENSIANAGFGVTHYSCTTNYTFAHELGHNLGLHHDRYKTISNDRRTYEYMHGYVNQRAFRSGAPADKRWRTVMSYDLQCTDARFEPLPNVGYSCVPLRRFSNPDHTYQGDPLGVRYNDRSRGADGPADARRRIREMQTLVANFRQRGGGPDLVVESPTVSDTTLTPRQSFRFSVTYRNSGDRTSTATTLTFYRGSAGGSRTTLHTERLPELRGSQGSSAWIQRSAPTQPGSYSYFACVESFRGEINTRNNCSTEVNVTVSSTGETRPDLVVESPMVSDPTLDPGEPFTFSATVQNRGGGTAAATTLRYETRSGRSPWSRLAATDRIPSLAVAETSPQFVRLQAPREPGVHDYRACVDVVSGESDHTNNCSRAVSATVAAPDLVVESPAVSKSSLDPREPFTFSATVRNRGRGTAAATTLRYETRTRGSSSWSRFSETDSIRSLSASGTSRRQSIGLTAPSDPGAYEYRACVDAVSGESDRLNNCSNPVSVTVGSDEDPDLVVESPAVSKSSLDPREPFTFSATVRNRGRGTAAATTLRYETRTRGSSSWSRFSETDSIRSLSASGTSRRQSIGLTAPSDPGAYEYRACVDAVSGESDRLNNCSNSVSVTVGSDEDPDLVVESPAVSKSSLDPREPFTFSATVRNRGRGTAAATTLRYETRTRGSSSWSRFSETDSIRSLSASGTSRRQSIGLTAPSDPGAYEYRACVDAVSGESDRLNNCSNSVSVTVGSDEDPDLVVESPAVSKSSLDPREPFTFSATVRNRGRGTAAATTLRYETRTRGSSSWSRFSETDSIRSLSASGTSRRQSIGLTAPSDPDAYEYRACVDAVSGESDRLNNCSNSVSVTVGSDEDPDLVVESPAVSKSSLDPREPFTFSATVRNRGRGTAAATTLRYETRTRGSSSWSRFSETDSIRSLSASGTSRRQSIGLTAPSDPGAYEYRACVDAVSGESDRLNNCSNSVSVTVGSDEDPDLVVESPAVSKSSLDPREPFTFSATVRNRGRGTAAATTLRYETRTRGSSSWSRFSETDSIRSLSASGTSRRQSIGLTAPSDPGAYEYRACVDAVSGESDRLNNCSNSVSVTVGSDEDPDLVVESPSVEDADHRPLQRPLNPGEFFWFTATVRNQGGGTAAATPLRYQNRREGASSWSTLPQMWSIRSLSASKSTRVGHRFAAPTEAGTYYYRGCVDSVSGESNTANNCSTTVSVAVEGVGPSDRAALEALYDATDGADWTNSTNWKTSAPLDDWHGVTADTADRVTMLDLNNNRLTGSIPPALEDLGNLEQLHLWNNRLTGAVPTWLGNMTRLRQLNLGGNQLTGPIPGSLASLVNLEQLYLWGNELTGPVPAWLGSMTQLRRLNLGNNAFSPGPIPGSLASLVNLEQLYLWGNELTGPVPAWLGSMTQLRRLNLGNNAFSPGPIPGSLASLVNLEQLYLYENNLTGPIPVWLGNLVQLEWLALSDNSLSGEIPPGLTNLRRLERLYLSGNRLTGRIPAWLGGLTNLRILTLGGSGLTGPIPRELGNLTNLETLYLWGLGLTGPIPAWLGSLGNLSQLSLSRNGLTGAIPPELGSLANLQRLWLYENPLTGTVPESLTRLSLAVFWIHDTGVCVPVDAAFQAWVATIEDFRGNTCTDSSNRPPEPVGTLGPLTIGVNDTAVAVEVSGAFRDPDRDRLTYGARSSAPGVASVSVLGSRVTVTPVSAGAATVTVTATDTGGSNTPASQAFRVTVVRPFTDHPIVPGVTPVKAFHFTELRTRIDGVRAAVGVGRYGWTDRVLTAGVTRVRLRHLLELRWALEAAYRAAGRSAPSWTDAVPTAGTTPIRAAHLMELRAAVVALE